ncbi:hypothetical protein DOE63_14370 [Salmonella enterica subsp. diarizonae serovar 59:z10:-]|nr:hypothetical protein DOE63_14370 [Salmonella enterica subsp. diarizonae serovar 59:z10:-]
MNEFSFRTLIFSNQSYSQKGTYAIAFSLIAICTMKEFEFCLLSGYECTFYVKNIGGFIKKQASSMKIGINLLFILLSALLF